MADSQFFINNMKRKNGWYGLILMVVVLILLFFLVKSIFSILYWLSPLLLILTLIFDYKVFISFGKWLWQLAKKNWLYALLVVVLGVIAFPILAGGLFVNAFMNWRLKKAKKKFGVVEEKEDKFSRFEILEEESMDLKDPEEIRKKNS